MSFDHRNNNQHFGFSKEVSTTPSSSSSSARAGHHSKNTVKASTDSMFFMEGLVTALCGKFMQSKTQSTVSHQDGGIFSRCLNKQDEDSFEKQQQRSGDGDMSAGHVGRYVSLANPDATSRMMCHLPLSVQAGALAIFAVIFCFSVYWCFVACVILSIACAVFVGHMCYGAFMGRYTIIENMKIDWAEEWEEFKKDHPGSDNGLLHIVILPNYKEDEDMLSDTIQNITENGLNEHTVCVLGMEAREGHKGKEKADRLCQKFRGRFKEMFATYHPPNIPCEVAGKSSNTQWAFREVQRWFGSYVSQTSDDVDPSKVFVTVADADAIHHPHYWLNLTVKALSTPAEERVWTIYQPPILCLRNLETVPALIRVQAYATIFFEMSSVYNADKQMSMSFSAYTAPYQLLNHPMVDGWDTDVIAEDHHMFYKCSCASYWEQVHTSRSANSSAPTPVGNSSSVGGFFGTSENGPRITEKSKLRLTPIWLAMNSYMAEDTEGVWATLVAKFQQSRRHAQGVAEISYLALQWATLKEAVGPGNMCFEAQWHLFKNIWKYLFVVCITPLQGLFMVILACYLNVHFLMRFLNDQPISTEIQAMLNPDDDLMWLSVRVVQLYTPVMVFATVMATYFLVVDNLEGRWTPLYKMTTLNEKQACEKTRQLTSEQKLKWLGFVLYDYLGMGYIGQVFYGLVPISLACIGLSRNGHKFEYIVAAKPESMKKSERISLEKEGATPQKNDPRKTKGVLGSIIGTNKVEEEEIEPIV